MNKDKKLENDLEELEKTTNLLKEFKPRMSSERDTADLTDLYKELQRTLGTKEPKEEEKTEKIEQKEEKTSYEPCYEEDPPVVPVYEDVDTLESAPIPSYPASPKEEEKVEEMVSEKEEPKEMKVEPVEVIETVKKEETLAKPDKPTHPPKKKKKYGIRSRRKRYGKRLILVSLLLVPGLLCAIIVASHSHLLINRFLETLAYVALGICCSFFFVGCYFLFRNWKARTIRPKKLIIKVFFGLFMASYVGCCGLGLYLLYGPDYAFRDWLVTTAMSTLDHQYYCQWFYSDQEIASVFDRNYLEEPDESTNPDLVQVLPPVPTTFYENEYEEAVLEHEEGAIYKMIQFEVNGCKAYLAVIYDPSRVGITVTRKVGVSGEYVTDMAKRENAVIATNGAGFYDPGHDSSGGHPIGITIVDGKIITNNEYGQYSTGGIIGFTYDHKLILLKRGVTAEEALEMGVKDAMSWGPFLIVNGKAAFTRGNGGWGYAARTAIGQRKDGIVLLLVVDSNANRTKGADMVDLTEIMKNYGAFNAACLDSGTSSVMVENGVLISDPIDSTLSHRTRPISTAVVVRK